MRTSVRLFIDENLRRVDADGWLGNRELDALLAVGLSRRENKLDSRKMKLATVALALLETVEAFQAPTALRAPSKAMSARMGEEDLSPDGFGGTLGVLPPLGLFDPLGLIETRDMRRYEIMEIKHGRAAMLGFLHVIHIESGVRFEGYLSPTNDLKFADVPAGLFASLEAVPTLGWLQIMAFTCAGETGYAATPWALVAQEDDKIPGDIGGSAWVRYDEEGEKAYKLNVERQNGRAAMLGITGCLIHELLGERRVLRREAPFVGQRLGSRDGPPDGTCPACGGPPPPERHRLACALAAAKTDAARSPRAFNRVRISSAGVDALYPTGGFDGAVRLDVSSERRPCAASRMQRPPLRPLWLAGSLPAALWALVLCPCPRASVRIGGAQASTLIIQLFDLDRRRSRSSTASTRSPRSHRSLRRRTRAVALPCGNLDTGVVGVCSWSAEGREF